MKKQLLTIFALLNFMTMNAQPDVAKLKATKPGTFAGFTYSTPDIEKGIQYLGHLNYKVVKKGYDDVYLSDGSVLLRLVKGNEKLYEVTYYSDKPEMLIQQFKSHGVTVDKNRIIADKCVITISQKVAGVSEPNSTSFMTMAPADYMDDTKYPNKKCGAYGEWAIPVEDIDESIAWWEKLGFEAPMKMMEPYPHAILTDGLIIIGLHQTEHFTEPTLTYFAPKMEPKVKVLREEGMEGIKTTMGDTDKNVVLELPGGQNIFLFSMGM